MIGDTDVAKAMADFTKDQIIKWLVKRLATKMDELRELRKKLHKINSKK